MFPWKPETKLYFYLLIFSLNFSQFRCFSSNPSET